MALRAIYFQAILLRDPVDRFRNYETVIFSVYRSGGEARGWGQGWLGVRCIQARPPAAGGR